jgi:hypothetical protein
MVGCPNKPRIFSILRTKDDYEVHPASPRQIPSILNLIFFIFLFTSSLVVDISQKQPSTSATSEYAEMRSLFRLMARGRDQQRKELRKPIKKWVDVSSHVREQLLSESGSMYELKHPKASLRQLVSKQAGAARQNIKTLSCTPRPVCVNW